MIPALDAGGEAIYTYPVINKAPDYQHVFFWTIYTSV